MARTTSNGPAKGFVELTPERLAEGRKRSAEAKRRKKAEREADPELEAERIIVEANLQDAPERVSREERDAILIERFGYLPTTDDGGSLSDERVARALGFVPSEGPPGETEGQCAYRVWRERRIFLGIRRESTKVALNGADFRKLARTHSVTMLGVAVDIATDLRQPAHARILAVNTVLERGHGRPLMTVPTSDDLNDAADDMVRQLLEDAANAGGITIEHDTRPSNGGSANIGEEESGVFRDNGTA